MDTEKEVLLAEKINVDTVTQNQRSNHQELLASTSLSPEGHEACGTKSRLQSLPFPGLLVLWFNSL